MLEHIPSLQEIIDTIIGILKTNQFAQGGALISFLVALPRYIIPWFIQLYRRIERLVIYRANIEETDDLYYYFEHWLAKNYNAKYRNVEAATRLYGKTDWNKDIFSSEIIDKVDEKVIYKQFNDLFHIRRGLNVIRVIKSREKLEGARDIDNVHYNKFIITGLFAKRTINKFIEEVHEYAVEKIKASRHKTIQVMTSDSEGWWVNETVVEPKPMSDIIVEGKEELLEDIQNFLKSREWYKKRSIGYKRGYLFPGPAGTGKTSFTLSLAKHIQRPICFLQLNGATDTSLRRSFRQLDPGCILVVEDIDAAFKVSDNLREVKGGFSMSTLLNCLDGVFATEDIIVIFTTNHPERLDSALKRTGRIDYELTFDRPSLEYVAKFLSIFYEKEIELKNAEYKRTLSMSDVQDYCLRNKTNVDAAIKKIYDIDQKKYKLRVQSANRTDSQLLTGTNN